MKLDTFIVLTFKSTPISDETDIQNHKIIQENLATVCFS